MTTKAIYCEAFCPHPIKFDPSYLDWMKENQYRQAKVLWSDWALKNLHIAAGVMENGRAMMRRFDIFVLEFPDFALPAVRGGHSVYRVSGDGVKTLAVFRMRDAYMKAIRRSWAYTGRGQA